MIKKQRDALMNFMRRTEKLGTAVKENYGLCLCLGADVPALEKYKRWCLYLGADVAALQLYWRCKNLVVNWSLIKLLYIQAKGNLRDNYGPIEIPPGLFHIGDTIFEDNNSIHLRNTQPNGLRHEMRRRTSELWTIVERTRPEDEQFRLNLSNDFRQVSGWQRQQTDS